MALIFNTSLRVGLVGICLITFAISGCGSRPPALEFWPYDAVKRTDSDYSVDGDRQLAALQKANPEADAELAFLRGDLRLVSERFAGVFWGLQMTRSRIISSNTTGIKYWASLMILDQIRSFKNSGKTILKDTTRNCIRLLKRHAWKAANAKPVHAD
jgi:hypothetical protein